MFHSTVTRRYCYPHPTRRSQFSGGVALTNSSGRFNVCRWQQPAEVGQLECSDSIAGDAAAMLLCWIRLNSGQYISCCLLTYEPRRPLPRLTHTNVLGRSTNGSRERQQVATHSRIISRTITGHHVPTAASRCGRKLRQDAPNAVGFIKFRRACSSLPKQRCGSQIPAGSIDSPRDQHPCRKSCRSDGTVRIGTCRPHASGGASARRECAPLLTRCVKSSKRVVTVLATEWVSNSASAVLKAT